MLTPFLRILNNLSWSKKPSRIPSLLGVAAILRAREQVFPSGVPSDDSSSGTDSGDDLESRCSRNLDGQAAGLCAGHVPAVSRSPALPSAGGRSLGAAARVSDTAGCAVHPQCLQTVRHAGDCSGLAPLGVLRWSMTGVELMLIPLVVAKETAVFTLLV